MHQIIESKHRACGRDCVGRQCVAKLVRLSLLLTVAALGTMSHAQASIVEADHPHFGTGAITRDTDQGLDFLDLTFSTNRSYYDVSGNLGPGGDFEGFRYATQTEIAAFINNYGFTPTVFPGQNSRSPAFVDTLSGLMELIWTPDNTSWRNVVSGISSSRASGLPDFFVRRFELWDVNHAQVTQYSYYNWDQVDASAALQKGAEGPEYGSFLVQDSPVVPEPATLAIWGTLSALGLVAARRRRGAA